MRLSLLWILSAVAAGAACADSGGNFANGEPQCTNCAAGGQVAEESEEEEEEEEENPASKPDAGAKDAGRADAGKKDAGKADAGKDAAASDAPVGADASATDSNTPFAGGGTVGDCQGQTALVADFGGVKPTVTSGFAIYAAGQHEVYAYSRAVVTDYAYGGQAGETKVRLLLPKITGPGQYQGMMGVFSWDTAQGKWVNYATPTQVVVVTIAAAQVVMPTGLMCNGWYIGRAEALFSPNNPVVLDFSVPLLTPSFPKSQPGPP